MMSIFSRCAGIPRISSWTWAVMSGILWCCSMPLVGLVLYAGQKQLTGFEILATGWLSPLMGNVAWFANPSFAVALLGVLTKKAFPKIAIASVFLALDTFRFSQYVLNEGGSTTNVYGYGWGAVVWFISLLLMLIAVGTLLVEQQDAGSSRHKEMLRIRPIGMFLLVVVVGSSTFVSLYDHQHANEAEHARLSGLAFKRAAVCAVAPPVARSSIRGFSGPLEIQFIRDGSITYPFNQPKELLGWGIGSVRIAGRDYFYEATDNGDVLSSISAIKPAAATLVIEDNWRSKEPRQTSIRLIDQSTKQVIVDQGWIMEEDGGRYCPDYSSFPKSDEQPRKVLLEALGIHVAEKTERTSATRELAPADNQAIATFHNSKGWASLADAQSLEDPAVWGEKRTPSWKGNINCPNGIGWDGSGWGRGKNPADLNTGWPFMVGGRAFYVNGQQQNNALCTQEYVYLFSSFAREKQGSISIEKRRLSDFSQQWIGSVVLTGEDLPKLDNRITIRSVEEHNDGVVLKLRNEESMRTAIVKATLKTKSRSR